MERNKVIEFAKNKNKVKSPNMASYIRDAGIVGSTGGALAGYAIGRSIDIPLKGAMIGGMAGGYYGINKALKNEANHIDNKLEDNYSVGAGSPGGGAVGSMGGNTNKGLRSLEQDHHIKALKFAKDKMLSKDNNYATISLSDRLRGSNKKVQQHIKDGIDKKDLTKQEVLSWMEGANKKQKSFTNRMQLKAKAKTGKATPQELIRLKLLNQRKQYRRGINMTTASINLALNASEGRSGVFGQTNSRGYGEKYLDKANNREFLDAAKEVKDKISTKGYKRADRKLIRLHNKAVDLRKKAITNGNRERQKQVINDSNKKFKGLRKLGTHLKSKKSLNKLGHYK